MQQPYQVLARKWRPQRFEDVVGQEHISRTLKNAIASGRIHHAFLFIGSRGIGKTTTARILAKALNCLSSDKPTPEPCGECENCRSISNGSNIDVIEIDGASNNSVEDVREIRDNIRMMPNYGRYKVYIIDEVHQLSLHAFNALLKTLEEPPPHAVFILATTESHKVPATIISRCQRYDFRRVPVPRLVDLLQGILEKEGKCATPEALQAIARAAEGGVRDAESILDELITYCDDEIGFKDVFEVLGLVDWQVLHELREAILERDVGRQLKIVEDVVASGKDLSQFVEEILRYFRNLLVCKTAQAGDLLHLPEDEVAEMNQAAQRFALTTLIRTVEQFATLVNGFDSQLAQRIALESTLIRMSRVGVDMSIDSILEKLAALGAGGIVADLAPVPEAQRAQNPRPQQARGAPANPPEAGSVAHAPAAPATPQRATLTADLLPRFWPRLLKRLEAESPSVALHLGAGEPAGLEDGALLVRFSSDRAWRQKEVERPQDRQLIETTLAGMTDNIATFRTETAAPRPDTAQEAPPAPAYAATESPEVRAVLEDPGVQLVMHVFKGTIVAVKEPEAAKPD